MMVKEEGGKRRRMTWRRLEKEEGRKEVGEERGM